MPQPAQRSRLRLALAIGVALVVIVAAGWSWRHGREADDAGEAAAGGSEKPLPDPVCDPVLREPVGDAGDHIDDGSISHASAPPSYGDHSSRWEVRARSFYGVDDRPEVSVLVHNLEHGYNILWYDQSVALDSDALAQVQEIADSYAAQGRGRDPETAFIAVPWTDEDGGAFPDGIRYALTHWYADPTDRSRSRADEVGLTQYCAGISAEHVRDWMAEYPLRFAPEGYPDLR